MAERADRRGGGAPAGRGRAAPARAERAAAPRRRDEEVLQAAIKVFYERGYPDATIQDVADELGILKGSLYHYIATKEDLLVRLLEQVHGEVERILEEVVAEQGLAPLERLERYVRRQVLYNLDHLAQISIYYHDLERLSEPHRRAITDRRKAHERFVADLIGEAQAAGEADASLDARLVANCVFATIIWPYRWYRPGRDDRDEIAELCATFALAGVVGERVLT